MVRPQRRPSRDHQIRTAPALGTRSQAHLCVRYRRRDQRPVLCACRQFRRRCVLRHDWPAGLSPTRRTTWTGLRPDAERQYVMRTGMKRPTAELVASKLDEASRRVLAAFAGHPAARRANMLMESRADGTWSLRVTIPSPTGDRRRRLAILARRELRSIARVRWMALSCRPLGRRPGRGPAADAGLLGAHHRWRGRARRLPTIGDGMPYRVLDLMDRQEILDELTAPTIPSDMKLLSWSGAEDAVLNDLREGPHNQALNPTGLSPRVNANFGSTSRLHRAELAGSSYEDALRLGSPPPWPTAPPRATVRSPTPGPTHPLMRGSAPPPPERS